jgi:hypothetical protein
MNMEPCKYFVILILASVTMPLTSIADVTFRQTTYAGSRPGDRGFIEFKVNATDHEGPCEINVFVMPTRIVVIANLQNTWFPLDTTDTFDHQLVIYGSAFDDEINIRGEAPIGLHFRATVAGLAGNDYIHVHKNIPSWLDGNDGKDSLHGGSARDHIMGGRGDDLIGGGAGHDDLHGQDGHDIVLGHDGRDVVAGGPGQDYLSGGADDDELWGGEPLSSSTLYGWWFYRPDMEKDTMLGGLGRDSFHSAFYHWASKIDPVSGSTHTDKHYIEEEFIVDFTSDDFRIEHCLPVSRMYRWWSP